MYVEEKYDNAKNAKLLAEQYRIVIDHYYNGIEIKEDSSPCYPDSFEEGFYDLVEDTIKEIKDYTGYTANIELMYVDNVDEDE